MNDLILILKKEYDLHFSLKKSFLILLFSYLTFCGAVIKIYTPLTPVPFTLQNLILFISIYYLSAKETGISQLLYILFGFIGLPVFAAGFTGAAIFLGPTAGYLIGFVLSGVIMAFIYNRIKIKNFIKIVLLFSTGAILILVCGTLHLAFIYGTGIKKGIIMGFLPFILTDIFKAFVAASFCKIKR